MVIAFWVHGKIEKLTPVRASSRVSESVFSKGQRAGPQKEAKGSSSIIFQGLLLLIFKGVLDLSSLFATLPWVTSPENHHVGDFQNAGKAYEPIRPIHCEPVFF